MCGKTIYKILNVERFLIRNDCNTYSLSHPTVLLDTVIGPDTELKLVAGEGFDYSWFPEDGLSCIDCQFPIAYINGDITYEVEYKDEYNCLAKEAFIFTLRDCDSTLGKNNILKLDTIIHYKSTLQLKAREGQYNYEWYPTDGLSCSDCPTTSLEINSSMEYSVRSLDKYSCELIERFRITKESNDIIIPNVITPNNDGINDYFEIIGLIPESILEIYNNRGVLVYKSEDYDGNWMGTDFNGNLLPKNNTYWYFLKTPDNKPKKGWVYIK